MCIRDRGKTWNVIYPDISKIAPLEKLQSMSFLPSELVNDCLLYTSDAADERSSGDLGGCRIIKKKLREDLELRLSLN